MREKVHEKGFVHRAQEINHVLYNAQGERMQEKLRFYSERWDLDEQAMLRDHATYLEVGLHCLAVRTAFAQSCTDTPSNKAPMELYRLFRPLSNFCDTFDKTADDYRRFEASYVGTEDGQRWCKPRGELPGSPVAGS